MLIDTHCHIHEKDFPLDPEEGIARAHAADVMKMIVVGTSEESSADARRFASEHDGIFASIGVHPHESQNGWNILTPEVEASQKLVAVGEIGLDYFYNHSPRDTQIRALEEQIAIAQKLNLPIIFHVREAFDDFWPIFDNFHNLRGELHSFTDNQANLEAGLGRGLFIGVNGISTFAKKPEEQAMFAAIPMNKMLLETDAPFLTPAPYRGTVNEPAYVREVAKFHAEKRGISLDEISAITSANATALFAI